jgi:hypothetical protein
MMYPVPPGIEVVSALHYVPDLTAGMGTVVFN